MAENALIIVDVQKCFLPSGSLSVPDGDQIIPVLNKYIQIFSRLGMPIYATRDWHPKVTKHFKAQGGNWPEHCVENTPGAAFADNLEMPKDVEIISKGTDPESEGYSGFEGTNSEGLLLEESLRDRGVLHLYMGGLATDYCVKSTLLEALQRGFRATLLMDAVRGVNLNPLDSKKAVEAMIRAGARMANLSDVEGELGLLVR